MRFSQLLYGLSIFVFITLMPPSAKAQQLSYPGGQTLVIQNQGSQRSAEFNHSIQYDVSIGGLVEYNDESDAFFIGPQATWLVKRINGDASQANFIISGGIGNLSDNGNDRVSGFVQVAADTISTKHFLAYSARAILVEERDTQIRQTVRGGIALYPPTKGRIQPFIALQVDRFDGPLDAWRAAPFIRLVKDAFVGEIGINDDGGLIANLVVLF